MEKNSLLVEKRIKIGFPQVRGVYPQSCPHLAVLDVSWLLTTKKARKVQTQIRQR